MKWSFISIAACWFIESSLKRPLTFNRAVDFYILNMNKYVWFLLVYFFNADFYPYPSPNLNLHGQFFSEAFMSYLKENEDKNTKVYLFNMKCAQNKHQVIKSMTLDYISNGSKWKINLPKHILHFKVTLYCEFNVRRQVFHWILISLVLILGCIVLYDF